MNGNRRHGRWGKIRTRVTGWVREFFWQRRIQRPIPVRAAHRGGVVDEVV